MRKIAITRGREHGEHYLAIRDDGDFGFVMMTNIAVTAGDDALRKLAADLYKGFSG